jgi:predicted nuclease with RNAse H fold
LYSRRLRLAELGLLAQLAERVERAEERAEERVEERAEEEIDNSAAIAAFIRILGCRRAVISRYIDGEQLSCREVEAAILGEAVVLYNNCEA